MHLARFAVACLALTFSAVPAGAAALPASPAATLDLAPTPEKIASDCALALPALTDKLDAIAALPRDQRTFDTVALAVNNAYADATDALAADLFMDDVGPAKPQRDAAAACRVALSNVVSQQNARPDLYAAFADANRSNTAKTVAQKKLLSDDLIDARRAGAALSPAQRAEYLALSARMTALRRAYAQNVNETRTPLRFTAAQLAGLSADRLAAFAKEGDGYVVPAISDVGRLRARTPYGEDAAAG